MSEAFTFLSKPLQERLLRVQDTPTACPYIDSTIARMPLHYPIESLTAYDVDELLAAGFRRSGTLLYFTHCAPCHACEPARVDVRTFRWSRSFKRILRRAETDLKWRWQTPVVDQDRVRLYNSHRLTRDLGTSPPIDAADYESFLTESCWPTQELEVRLGGGLIAVSIMDIGHTSVSAVYTHFDPEAARYSLGTFAVLQQIQWAIEHDKQYVYLGLYVHSNPHLNYKARFTPQQRLIGGTWHDIQSSPT